MSRHEKALEEDRHQLGWVRQQQPQQQQQQQQKRAVTKEPSQETECIDPRIEIRDTNARLGLATQI